MMEIKKCKNKKCQKTLPEGYKHKYCESCRNEQVKLVKDTGKKVLGTVAGVAVIVGSTAVTILTNGKINPKK